MAGLRVRYDRQLQLLVVGEGGSVSRIHDDGTGTFLGHLDDVRAASATELDHALARSEADGLDLSDVDYSLFDYEYSPRAPVSFVMSNNRLQIDIIFFLNDFEDEDATRDAIYRTVSSILRREDWKFVEIEMDGASAASPWLWHLRVEPRTRARTVGDLYDIATKISDLVSASSGSGLRRETVLELLRAGRAEVLIGQTESDWLEVKSQDYDLSKDAHKISLAQDVARFANAEYGGIIIVGMKAKKTGDREIIREVRVVPLKSEGVRRHRQAINHYLFPPPDGLTVEEVFLGQGRLIMLHIPPQADELKPFLVQGAIVNGRVEGAFISIVRRRGELSIPITAAAIHTTLAAGRALLRRGTLPEKTPVKEQ